MAGTFCQALEDFWRHWEKLQTLFVGRRRFRRPVTMSMLPAAARKIRAPIAVLSAGLAMEKPTQLSNRPLDAHPSGTFLKGNFIVPEEVSLDLCDRVIMHQVELQHLLLVLAQLIKSI